MDTEPLSAPPGTRSFPTPHNEGEAGGRRWATSPPGVDKEQREAKVKSDLGEQGGTRWPSTVFPSGKQRPGEPGSPHTHLDMKRRESALAFARKQQQSQGGI